MSYTEYYDLFENAQKNGKYFVVIFDGKNHKSHLKYYELVKAETDYKNGLISKEELQNKKQEHFNAMNAWFYNCYNLTTTLTEQILKLETDSGKRILHRNEEVYLANHPYQWYEADKLVTEGSIKNIGRINPNFAMGDSIWFIFEKDTMTEKQIKNMFSKQLDVMNLPYEFWCGSGYYETDKREEKNEKLFREYAMQMIEDKSKQHKKNVVSAKTHKQSISFEN